MSQSYDVFLSHSDADTFAVETLALKLQEAGIKPFLDKWHLIPGELWQPKIEKGLRNSAACIIFVGSEGIGPWHRQEMLVALDRAAKDPDFPAIPVLLPGFKRPADVPDFLAQRTWVEFLSLEDREAFHRLVSGIRGKEPLPARRRAAKRSQVYRCMAQPPEGWIHRREYNEVFDALCSKQTAPAGRSVGITTALKGAGGFGKTALAQKLCFDKRVQKAYPDGILWATMGEEADSNSRLKQIRDLLRWWTQEEPPAFETVAAASAKLRESLNEARALVVVDDVWSPDDVAPFQGLGEGCALLITTRDSRTLPTDSIFIKVDAMASSEAVDLLKAGLPDISKEKFTSLATRLGEWPLLLKLVNGALRDSVQGGLSTPEALKEIEEALATEGYSAFDQSDPVSRHVAASKTTIISVRRLSEVEQELFLRLVIFPEDQDVDLSVLQRYWGISIVRVRKICQRFYELSLLLNFNRGVGTIRLHDVIRRVMLEHRPDAIAAFHSRLLDIYRPPSRKWEDMAAGNSYMWRRLRDHFLGAGLQSEFEAFLGAPGFIESKLNATDINSVLADYEPFVAENKSLRLVRDSLRLSAHILSKDPGQLAIQLYGRLLGSREPNIRILLKEVRSWRKKIWIRPRTRSMTQAGGALLRTLEGHASGINSVAVVDARRAISGSSDGTLRLWDLESGQTLRVFVGHKSEVSAVAAIDHCQAISASADGSLRLWDLESGKTIKVCKGHLAEVKAVAILSASRFISASTDRTLRVWDLRKGKVLQVLEGHTSWIRSLAIVDAHRVISASDDRTLRVWDWESGKALKTLKGHKFWIRSVVVSGRRAISASADGTLRVWSLSSGKCLRVIDVRQRGTRALAVVDERRIISASADGKLRLFDLESGAALQTFEGHTAGVKSVALVSERRAISASVDGTLRVWDLEVGKAFRSLSGHTAAIKAVAVAKGRRAVSASADGSLGVWNMGTGGNPLIFKGHRAWVRAVSVVEDALVVSASDDATLIAWDLESGKRLFTLEGHSAGVRAVANIDNRRVVSASGDGTMRIWELQGGSSVSTISDREGHISRITAIANIDGRHVISASGDGNLYIWNLKKKRPVLGLKGHTAAVHAVAVLDRCRAISASADRTLRVWDLESGQTLHTFSGHSDFVTAVAILRGQRIISASEDRTLRIWGLGNGKELLVVTLDAPIIAVATTPDGKMVVAGDQSGKVHFFDLVESK